MFKTIIAVALLLPSLCFAQEGDDSPVSPPMGVDSDVANCSSTGCVGTGSRGYWSSTTSRWDGGSSTHVYGPDGQYQVTCSGGTCRTWGK